MQRNNKYKEVDKTMKGNVLMSEEKVKIIPLGGLGEIGKNITAFECEECDNMVCDDCININLDTCIDCVNKEECM